MHEMPENWRDNDAWELYWQRAASRLSSGHYWAVGQGRGARLLRQQIAVPFESASGRRRPRILFAGNGNSPEPWLYANWGCECLAVDVSSTACAAVEKLRRGRRILERFYCETECCEILETEPGEIYPYSRPDLATARSRLRAERREGGSVEVTCADLFSYEPAKPVDAIVSRFTFQRFSAQDRDDLAARLASWLIPAGLLLIEGRFVPGGWEDFEDRHRIHSHLRQAGFFIHQGDTTRLAMELGLRAHRQHVSGVKAGETALSVRETGMQCQRLGAEELEREARFRAAGGRVAAIDLSSG